MSQHDRYISPFSTRYSSDEMQYIFSDDNKFRTWRRLWVALARAEMEQGLTNITTARRESKNEPSPSRLRRATSPEGRGFMHHQKRRYDKSSPLGGAGIEQSEMTERVKTSLFRSTVSENIRSFTISH